MMNKPPHCDIFCTVVDNYGDAGVCWRLANQLAREHGWRVRVWIDDLKPLQQLAPDCANPPLEVCTWPSPWPETADTSDIADIVIEAFACDLPPRYIENMATCEKQPVWLNLEYLTAESWATGCHAMKSPHPRLPLLKYFFFPGFDDASGGLLREADYDERRRQFDESAFRAEFGLPPRAAGELTISLFSYPNPALDDLISAWQTWARPERPLCVLCPGKKEPARTEGSLTLQPLPFLPQNRYDELLWTCDLNFVRGEDSFVRAQWAAKPFVWQIYPQEGDAHRVKLDAFLALHPAGADLMPFWHAWNGWGKPDWQAFAGSLPALEAPIQQWANTLAARPDLASTLVQFCLERLK
ncbi:MAG: elongation factor P maturation arginine rhamnosyltransferase EarP [Sulfuritalea sp.]|nr:elongation factor P maturation arginine rhamnosyltransferase EarP [Sulfuritalea sp.]